MQEPPRFGDTLLRDARADLYTMTLEDFWDDEGRRRLSWFRPYRQLYEWDLPNARWYLGGLTNACFNCVDRHVDDGHGGKIAYVWEGEPEGERRTLTFVELQREVVLLANGLRRLGVHKGTRVGIHMGMVPELPVAMLACARIGAPHVVVAAAETAESLSRQLNQTECSVLITQDETFWRGRRIGLKNAVDRALATCPTIANCIVLRRTGGAVSMTDGRDLWWQHLTAGIGADPRSCPCEPMDSEDLLFVTYSDDGAGPPAGVMHTTAGYLVGAAATHEYVFDVKDESVYWCKADIGSIAGHSYAVYGPLCNGTTTVICEGAPDDDRHRAVVRRHAVSVVYSARDDLAWSPPASGMILISPLAGLRGGKPGCAGRPFPGVETAVYDGRGRGVAQGSAGHLVVRTPYPAMPRGLYGEPERYRRTYWERFPGVCFTRAWARIDADGDYWILAARN